MGQERNPAVPPKLAHSCPLSHIPADVPRMVTDGFRRVLLRSISFRSALGSPFTPGPWLRFHHPQLAVQVSTEILLSFIGLLWEL